MWTPPLWSPPVALSPAEQQVAARAATRKKFFVFLRESRGELFNDAFQEELLEMYRQTGAGKPPVPPALLAMATVLLPETTLDAVLDQDFDMVVLPGGLGGAQRLEADQRIAVLLRRMTEQGRFVAAICAAPRVLASAGLLKDREATAYPGILDSQPEIRLSSAAVVRDGALITSRGPGTAMDFSLSLIEILCGREQRDTVEKALQRS